MNVDDLLRSADPVRPLPPGHVDHLLAESRRRRDAVVVEARPPQRRWRPVAAAAVAAVLVGGVVAVVSSVTGQGNSRVDAGSPETGNIVGTPRATAPSSPPAVSLAAPTADVIAALQARFGADVSADRARALIRTPGPEGTTLTLWEAPGTGGSICQAALISPASPPLQQFASQLCYVPSAGSGSGGSAEPTQTGYFADPWQWTSPTTGVVWSGYSGRLNPGATQVQTRLDRTVLATTPVVEDLFLTGPVATTATGCPNYQALDASGQVATPPTSMSSTCEPPLD